MLRGPRAEQRSGLGQNRKPRAQTWASASAPKAAFRGSEIRPLLSGPEQPFRSTGGLARLSAVRDFTYEGRNDSAEARKWLQRGTVPLRKPTRTNTELETELVRRTAERDEALAREAAAVEVLGVINSSPGDLAPVFHAILQRAHSLCEAEYGHIYTFDDGQFSPVAIKGGPEFIAYRRQRGPFDRRVTARPRWSGS
jgi:hypothetical protein